VIPLTRPTTHEHWTTVCIGPLLHTSYSHNRIPADFILIQKNGSESEDRAEYVPLADQL
jgi:hypothetical protein